MWVSAVETTCRALKLHIQPAISFGGECYANNIARIGNGKTRQFRVGKDRATFWLVDDVWQLTGAVQHKEQFSKQRPGSQKTRPAVLRKFERFTVTR